MAVVHVLESIFLAELEFSEEKGVKVGKPRLFEKS